MSKEKHRCAGQVLSGFGWRHSACTNPGKYKEDDKWWCGRHRPSAVAARTAKADEKHRLGCEADNAWRVVRDAKRAVMDSALRSVKANEALPEHLKEAVAELLDAETTLRRAKERMEVADASTKT